MAVAIFVRAFYSIAAKYAVTNVRVHYTNFSVLFLGLAGLIALGFSFFYEGIDLSILREETMLISLTIFTMVIGNVVYFKGQDMVDAGTTQIALSTKLVWAALLAMPILGTTYDGLQVLGMFILAGAILLTSKGISKGVASWGALLIAVSAISFAFNSIYLAQLAEATDVHTYLAVSYLGTAIFTIPLGLKNLKKDVSFVSKNKATTVKSMLFASLTSLVYFVAIYNTFNQAGDDRGLVSVLTNVQVVTTVLLAAIVLKERDQIGRKIFASMLVLLAAYLISGI
ncbi:MAG: DMT family transporter [Patescibacteria group bacterium]